MVHRFTTLLSSLRQFHRAAPMTSTILWANIFVFLITWIPEHAEAVLTLWGLTPGELVRTPSLQPVSTLLTSMFLHGSILHLACNMLMLVVFGRFLESRMQSYRFLGVYFMSGLLAASAQVLINPSSTLPMVGASGALSGLLGAAVLLAPTVRLWIITPFTFFVPIPMRMVTLGVVWVTLQIGGLIFSDPFSGGIAYGAHLGGFVGGYLLQRWIRLRRSESVHQNTPHRPDIRFGPAPNTAFRTFFVTDSRGQTFVFHSPEG